MQLAVESAFMPSLLDLVSRQIQQKVNSQQIVANMVQDAAAQLLDSQAVVLAEEKQRLKELDALERQARAAREQEILRRERERARIEAEQQSMMEWEQYEPPLPPGMFEIASWRGDEGMAVLADGRECQVAPDDQEALAQMLEGLQDQQRVMGQLSAETEGEPQRLHSFVVQDRPQDPPVDGTTDVDT
jgi:hypothetical protein